MNIQILDSWLREYVKTNAKAEDIARCLALCGPSVETVVKTEAHHPIGKNHKHSIQTKSTPTKQKDYVYDIEVTTNRVDMMSVHGIAREAAAILPQFGFSAELIELKPKKPTKTKPSTEPTLVIKSTKELTKRVMAVVMEVGEYGDSPKWLQDRLEAAGIRSLNNLVDITNYIMTEVGHPTHVFDYDRIKSHRMEFRLTKKGETLITLDDKHASLPGDDIVIDNGNDEIIDLPGIMGTKNSVVTKDTKRIIFFIDNNDPKRMRRTSMITGIRTVAVSLNEKGVDPNLGETALYRGIELYQHIAKANVISKIHDHFFEKPVAQPIDISLQFISDRMGVKVKASTVKQLLKTLGFSIRTRVEKNLTQSSKKTENNKHLQVTPPSWRASDITIPEDVLEEVARIYGYHNLPSIVPQQEPPTPYAQAHSFEWEQQIKTFFQHLGFIETYTYSLVSTQLAKHTSKDISKTHLKLKNPLSTDWLWLRTQLLPSLFPVIHKNKHLTSRLQLFEMANVYLPTKNDLPKETLHLCMIQTNTDFFRLKGILEAVADSMGLKLEYKLLEKSSIYTPHQTAEVLLHNKRIGLIGEVHPTLVTEYELPVKTFACELQLDAMIADASTAKRYIPVPKYPAIQEDLTFKNPNKIPAATLIQASKQIKLTDVEVFIEIKGWYEQKLNVAVSYLNRKQNLDDKTITPIRKQLVQLIEQQGFQLEGTL
jgi:phenylalanyl-tRNA synthetase beta chain